MSPVRWRGTTQIVRQQGSCFCTANTLTYNREKATRGGRGRQQGRAQGQACSRVARGPHAASPAPPSRASAPGCARQHTRTKASYAA
eukprot:6209036-Pleurochrysis_carterae.AAC.2